MTKRYLKFIVCSFVLVAFYSCDQNELGNNDSIQYSSEQIKYGNLIAKISFEDNVIDSKGNLSNGSMINGTYTDGIKGKAYQGANGAYIAYNTVSSKIAGLKNITVSFWIKTVAHSDGAQCLYSIPKSEAAAFWGNNNMLIESNTTSNLMPVKTYFQKNTTTSTTEKWLEHIGDKALFGAYGDWSHIAWTYNGKDSKYYLYVNGQNVTSAAMTDSTSGFGFLGFSSVEKFIIGGFQQHLGAPWNAPETWMKTYTGAMDEFRIYDDALTASDIYRLYSFEKQGL